MCVGFHRRYHCIDVNPGTVNSVVGSRLSQAFLRRISEAQDLAQSLNPSDIFNVEHALQVSSLQKCRPLW